MPLSSLVAASPTFLYSFKQSLQLLVQSNHISLLTAFVLGGLPRGKQFHLVALEVKEELCQPFLDCSGGHGRRQVGMGPICISAVDWPLFAENSQALHSSPPYAPQPFLSGQKGRRLGLSCSTRWRKTGEGEVHGPLRITPWTLLLGTPAVMVQ